MLSRTTKLKAYSQQRWTIIIKEKWLIRDRLNRCQNDWGDQTTKPCIKIERTEEIHDTCIFCDTKIDKNKPVKHKE